MCGRYTLATPADELIETFDVGELSYDWFASYNIAPGRAAPIVAEDARGRRIELLRWGLIPSWRDVPGSGLINARAESVATKPSFREAFRRRRCLVPADGFYEWRRSAPGAEGGKQPVWFHPSGGGVVSFAGLWETWKRPGVDPKHTFTILTTEANDDVRGIHERMPVVVAAEDRHGWLDTAEPIERVTAILRPAPVGTFTGHPVSTRVNATGDDDAGLIAPLG